MQRRFEPVKDTAVKARLLDRLTQYFHTLKYLKLQQTVGRLARSCKRVQVPACVELERRPLANAFVPIQLHQRSLFDDNRFVFLNESGQFQEWNDLKRSKLWLYNLHYFDDLNSVDASSRLDQHRHLIHRWITENPPLQGNGWEAYPTSLRIVNWIKWIITQGESTPQQLRSLSVQASVLSQTLETHLLGNHLFVNGKALLFAGLFFAGDVADQWLTTALKILQEQLSEQVLADGGNFELSPMYHQIMLVDVLDMISFLGAYHDGRTTLLLRELQMLASKMLGWLFTMTHPDGDIALFNDAAINIAPKTAAILKSAQSLGIDRASNCQTLTVLPDSGYIRLEESSAVALLDVAKVGPDYIPGHAHADTLSFELSLFGQRIIVNGGTSCYGVGAVRLSERSTKAHSTVMVDGQNSSEVWSGFRVARRAYPKGLVVKEKAESLSIQCSHTGYRWLRGAPEHSRQWLWGAGKLCIIDEVVGGYESAVALFHLHPDLKVEQDRNSFIIMLQCGKTATLIVHSGSGMIESSSFSPEFGKRMDTLCIAVSLHEGKSHVTLEWEQGNDSAKESDDRFWNKT